MLRKVIAASIDAQFTKKLEVSETYEAFCVNLSSKFHERLINIWEEETKGTELLPPLPNLRINLPSTITEQQLIPPKNQETDAVNDRSKIIRSRWFDETIKPKDKMAYKNTYGAGRSISRNRKQLIDLELVHEFSFYICYMTAEVVRTPRELDADHVCSWEIIKQNIWSLVDAMNRHPKFAEAIMEEFAKHQITRAFIYKKEIVRDGVPHIIYYPTQWFFKIYFNDVSNILLIKKVENEDKSGHNIEDYFKNISGQLLYDDFLETTGINRQSIIHRTHDGHGLGEAMRYRFFQLNRDIVALFDSVRHITENLNKHVKHILRLRQQRQQTGSNVRGKIRAEQHRDMVLETASEISLSSSESDFDKDVDNRAKPIVDTLAMVLAKSYKIANAVVRELPQQAQSQIINLPGFILKLKVLIENELKGGE